MPWLSGARSDESAQRALIERLRAQLAAASAADARAAAGRALGEALAESGAGPAPDDPETVVVAAVCHAADKALAQSWLERVADETQIAVIAVQARVADVRFAAAQRLADGTLLERVEAATRERDKRVHRHCVRVLRERKERAGRVERAAELESGLTALLDDPPPLPVTRLGPLERALRALGECAETAACRALLARLHERLRQEGETLQQLQRAAARARTLTMRADEAWPPPPDAEARAEIDSLKAELAVLPAWAAASGDGRWLEQALGEALAHIETLAEDTARYAACEAFLAAQSDPAKAPDGAAWDALAKPRHGAARRALDARWTALLAARRPEPPPRPAARPKPDAAAWRETLDTLEAAIAEGRLADAEQAEARLAQSAAAQGVPRALEARWKRARAERARMSGWARWGNAQAHDQLIEQAERLLAEPPEVEPLAKAITALRAEWKRLDAAGPATRSQWERFDALVERAYQPVAAHRAGQAKAQTEARAAREAQLAQWEAWSAAFDWSQADWSAVQRQLATVHEAWRKGAHASHRDERALRKRYDAFCESIEARLRAAREAEHARREALIAEAEGLAEETDLGRATAAMRELQARWRDGASGVYLGRGRDSELWRRFRAACDKPYARRDAQRSERAARAEQELETQRARLDALERALEAGNAGEIDAALAQRRAAPRAGLPRELEARERALMRRAGERAQALRHERQASRYAVLAQKAGLAREVEQAAAAGADVEAALERARSAWAGLPAARGATEAMLVKRLDAASAATAESLAEGGAARARLLLELELALDLPTPPEHAEARRARQLERLKERFSAGPASDPPETLLARWYATAAPDDAAQEARIAEVVRVLAAQAVAGSRTR